VKYTGRPLRIPLEMHVRKEGVAITFAEKLDKASVEDVGRYGVARWNYRWTESYGSKRYRVSDPNKEGMDEVNVVGAKLEGDGRTVLLKLEDLRPVMQMRIDVDVKTAEGEVVKTTVYSTINKMP